MENSRTINILLRPPEEKGRKCSKSSNEAYKSCLGNNEADGRDYQTTITFRQIKKPSDPDVENLVHAVALHFTYYNFARVHQTLRVTPAMEAGLADHIWTLREIVEMAECLSLEQVS